MKKKLVLIFIFLTATIFYKKSEPGWITAWGIDPTTYFFLSLIPLLWLFRVSSQTNGIIAIIFLVLMAFFSIIKQEQSSENMAIMAFFFFTISVFQQIKQFINSNHKNEDDIV